MAEAGPLGRTQAIRILQIGRTHEELIATIDFVSRHGR
jgi:hypothetical protein